MDVYIPLSHNLARAKDPSELIEALHARSVKRVLCVCVKVKRQSLVKRGRIDIVQCLRDLPPTKNHLSSFNVDVMRATVRPHLHVSPFHGPCLFYCSKPARLLRYTVSSVNVR